MRLSTLPPVIVRILMGALFVFSGANKVFPFMPMPPMPAPAGAFVGAMVATGYLLLLLGVTEVIAGALLIAGRFVPLALVVLAPIIVNIALFHLLLAPSVGIVVFLLASEIYLAWVYREAFRGVLQPAPALART
jgi:uncharacterized membrane protein YphA (DoxX/SURF4 family)